MSKKLSGIPNLTKPRIRTIGTDSLQKPLRGKPLSQTHPMLIEEWRHKGPDTPDTVTAGSGKRVNWQCSHCNNTFNAPVNVRTRAIDEGRESQGCKYCSKSNERNIQAPELLSDYLIRECIDEFAKTPKEKLLDNSSEHRLWRCSKCLHQYRSRIKARLGSASTAPQGCPVCFDGHKVNLRKIGLANNPNNSNDSLYNLFKKGRKNQGFNPNSLPSSYKVFWSCPKNSRHLPYMSCNEMLIGGCKSCINENSRVFLSEYKELVEQFVEAVRYRHWTPKNILEGSYMVVLWQCPKGTDHKWCTSVERRTIGNEGCPFCSNKRISVTNSFAAQYPELAVQWNHDANEVTPDLVKSNSREKYFFQCNLAHGFLASPWERIHRKVGCKICSEVKNSVAKTHPWAVSEWMERLNFGSTPWNTAPNSKKKIWWQCKRAQNHIYKKSVYDRCVRGFGCKRCRLEKIQ